MQFSIYSFDFHLQKTVIRTFFNLISLGRKSQSWSFLFFLLGEKRKKSEREREGNLKQVRKTDFYHLNDSCRIQIPHFNKEKNVIINTVKSKLQRNTGPEDWLSQITVFIIGELKWCFKRHNGRGMFAIQFLHFFFPLCTRLFWWSTCGCVQMDWTNCLKQNKDTSG